MKKQLTQVEARIVAFLQDNPGMTAGGVARMLWPRERSRARVAGKCLWNLEDNGVTRRSSKGGWFLR